MREAAAINKKAYISALVGAGICLFVLWTGVLTFFFLVPLGFLAYRCDYRTAWLASLFAIIGNAVLGFAATVTGGFPAAGSAWNILYFTVTAVIFTWITAPPPVLHGRISGVVRLLSGSCVGALFLSAVFLRLTTSPGFSEYADYLLRQLSSLYNSSGADVVENARLEMLTAESVLETVKTVMFRGGGLVSCVLMFAVCRQVSFFLARLFQREKISDAAAGSLGALTVFHVHPQAIWVLSSSLLLVVLAMAAKLEIPEIILWNVLVLCAMLYLAQGLGIAQFFLSRPGMSPSMRMSLRFLFVILLFFLNVVLLGGLVLLGVAENWAPFRVPKQNSPPSTPEAGDDDYF